MYQGAIKLRRGFVQPSPTLFLHSRERRRAFVPGEDDFLIGFLDLPLQLLSGLAFLLLPVDPPTHLLFLRLEPLVQIGVLALEPTQAVNISLFHLAAMLRSLSLRQGEQVAVEIIILGGILSRRRVR